MSTDVTAEVTAALYAWAAAERSGDVDAIGALLTGDFVAVGPWGFVLDRAAWIGRFASGLRYDALALDDVAVRVHGDAALVTATQSATGDHRGQPLPTTSRVSVTLVREGPGGPWRLAGMHLSFVAGTLGAPAFPGRRS